MNSLAWIIFYNSFPLLQATSTSFGVYDTNIHIVHQVTKSVDHLFLDIINPFEEFNIGQEIQPCSCKLYILVICIRPTSEDNVSQNKARCYSSAPSLSRTTSTHEPGVLIIKAKILREIATELVNNTRARMRGQGEL